jgi:hypothetical protein
MCVLIFKFLLRRRNLRRDWNIKVSELNCITLNVLGRCGALSGQSDTLFIYRIHFMLRLSKVPLEYGEACELNSFH